MKIFNFKSILIVLCAMLTYLVAQSCAKQNEQEEVTHSILNTGSEITNDTKNDNQEQKNDDFSDDDFFDYELLSPDEKVKDVKNKVTPSKQLILHYQTYSIGQISPKSTNPTIYEYKHGAKYGDRKKPVEYLSLRFDLAKGLYTGEENDDLKLIPIGYEPDFVPKENEKHEKTGEMIVEKNKFGEDGNIVGTVKLNDDKFGKVFFEDFEYQKEEEREVRLGLFHHYEYINKFFVSYIPSQYAIDSFESPEITVKITNKEDHKDFFEHKFIVNPIDESIFKQIKILESNLKKIFKESNTKKIEKNGINRILMLLFINLIKNQKLKFKDFNNFKKFITVFKDEVKTRHDYKFKLMEYTPKDGNKFDISISSLAEKALNDLCFSKNESYWKDFRTPIIKEIQKINKHRNNNTDQFKTLEDKLKIEFGSSRRKQLEKKDQGINKNLTRSLIELIRDKKLNFKDFDDFEKFIEDFTKKVKDEKKILTEYTPPGGKEIKISLSSLAEYGLHSLCYPDNKILFMYRNLIIKEINKSNL